MINTLTTVEAAALCLVALNDLVASKMPPHESKFHFTLVNPEIL